MSAQELITKHLDLWTGAVAKKSSSGRGTNSKIELTGIKKLRELILELAVRGKLVEQSPEDEPADLLLEQAQTEKRLLAKKAEIKKPRKLPRLSEMAIPFSVPESWEWAQLEDIGRDWGQKTPGEDFSYIDVASVDNVRGVTTEASLLAASDAPSRARKVVQQGTLIYSTVRPYLQNIAVVENEITPEPIASTAFAILHPLASMPARFFLHYLRSPTFVRYVESVQTGIAYPAINDKQFFSGVVPIPPLKEQYRIVQKVDELMALCDRLEQQTSDQLEAHETLVDTLLGTLTQSENATDLADNWARLAAHFDTLFTTEQSIDMLKQAILQLAVMGRLVPQNSSDEPAAALLEKIAAEKAQLVKEGEIKKPKVLLRITDEEKPIELPREWQWARLGSIAQLKGGFAYKSTALATHGTQQVVRMGNVRPNHLNLEVRPAFIEPELASSTFEYRIKKNSILLTMTGTKGKHDYLYTVVVGLEGTKDRDLYLNQRLCMITLNKIMPKFQQLVFNDYRLKRLIFDQSTGTANQANIGMSALENWVVPVPPLAEQRRIIEKVDELMALCDKLKVRLNQASDTRRHMAEAIVEQAVT